MLAAQPPKQSASQTTRSPAGMLFHNQADHSSCFTPRTHGTPRTTPHEESSHRRKADDASVNCAQLGWERQVTRWLASRGLVLGPDMALHAQLRDGVLLGQLLEGLDPSLRLTGFNRKAVSKGSALANLELVLSAIWRKGPLAKGMPKAEEVGAFVASACGHPVLCAILRAGHNVTTMTKC